MDVAEKTQKGSATKARFWNTAIKTSDKNENENENQDLVLNKFKWPYLKCWKRLKETQTIDCEGDEDHQTDKGVHSVYDAGFFTWCKKTNVWL